MTEHAVINVARAVQHLADDINNAGGYGSMGARIYVTLGAVGDAARAIKALAEDLMGYSSPTSTTTGTELRAALRRIGSKS